MRLCKREQSMSKHCDCILTVCYAFRGEFGDVGEDGLPGEIGEAIGSEYNVKGDKGIQGPRGIKG